jgi:predicted AAA+ superfamily ATPase
MMKRAELRWGFGFFLSTKGNGEPIYIQVAYEITEKNREREFGNFSSIKDNYPKYVISRDQVQLSENGIIRMNIVDFLLRPFEK